MDWNENSLKHFILYWNNNFPFDYWWRKKFNIAFNSPQHREMCLIDIKFVYDEEKLIDYYLKLNQTRKSDRESFKETGFWLKRPQYEITEEALEEAYDNLDLSQFDKIKT